MKSIYLLIIMAFISSSAFATRIDATGEVGQIRYHIDNGKLAPSWNKAFWFQLNNSDKNFCTSNRVSIKSDDEVAISILLAAKMANKKVLVTLDDTVKYPTNGYCLMQYITIL